MNFKKLGSYFSLISLNSVLVNSVQVVQKTGNVATETGVSSEFRNGVITFFTIGIMILMFVIGIIIFFWILLKIWNKLTEQTRKKKSIIYDMFLFDMAQCHFNADMKLKKKNWKLFWLFWKRKPIYVENKSGGLDVIGQYHGECIKKEGFYLIGVYNKVSFFKYIGQIIIIPLELKDKLVKKIEGKDKLLFLSCEGIDRIEGSDYYYIPLIPDPKDDDKFIDFSDKVHKQYIEVETYRDIITENLSSYREGIIKSVETNPYVHFGRRGGDSFKKQ